MSGTEVQFEWDDAKEAGKVRNHGVSFALAGAIFHDPRILTIADLEHSESEERWFSVGCASSGVLLCVVYLWVKDEPATTKIRLISARKATRMEIGYYQEGS